MPAKIEDYALLGDCATAALVSRDGSIDWLCLPRFDGAACFAAILGSPDHGRWQITPKGNVTQLHRRYREGTLVLETEYRTPDGVVTVIDCMTPQDNCHDVVRWVVGSEGNVPMQMDLVVRFDYGSIVPWVTRTPDGIRAVAGPDALQLVTPVHVHGENFRTRASFTVGAGQRIPFVLSWSPSHLPAPGPIDPAEALLATERWWQQWSQRCTYTGPYRDTVLRSFITLKALTYAETGSIVAAPTTSLPEQLGGSRNWDYRYCWLRDATFTLYALLNAGYTEEAGAFRDWLLRAAAGHPGQLQIMYGLAGERRLTEQVLDNLPGYENSRPVRIGNAAHEQLQLDVYGELLDTLHLSRRVGLSEGDDAWRLEQALLTFLESNWQKPDDGIWEIRGERKFFTHSRVMAWVAFDRAIKAIEAFGKTGPVDRWRAIRAQIHDEVCARGFNQNKQAFVQHYDTDALDASVLMIPMVGFLPATDPRVRSTVEAIERELLQDGLVQRYRTETNVDGLPPGEGAFLPCSFWLVDNYVLLGRRDDAVALYEKLLALCNDVGLLAEEYDTHAGRLVGNFPQAFSHIALINSARNLAEEDGPASNRCGTRA